jgi:hypothetical protein
MDYEVVGSPTYPTPNWSQFGDTIGNLANTFRSGQQQNQQHDISTAFQNGLPTDANGNPDYNKIMQVLAQKGDINAISSLSGPALDQNQLKSAQTMSPLLGGAPVAGQPTGGPTAPTGEVLGPAAPVTSAPLAPPSRAAMPPAMPAPAVSNVPAPGGAQLGDLSGASSAFPSVNSMVFSSLPDDWTGGAGKMQTIASNVAKAVKADPTAPMTQDQAAKAQSILSAYMQRNKVSPKTADNTGGLPAAILGQESANRDDVPKSIDGAVGPGQVIPKTFAAYAQPGEDINNPADNRRVSGRILADYNQRYGGDVARAAVAYFSGPDNVAPPGSPTPYKRDLKDGNGKSTSAYVNDIVGRLGGGAGQPAASAPGGGDLPPASAAAGIPTRRPPSNEVADNSDHPIGPQVPLPPGFNDPQQAILAMNKEMAHLSVNPRAAGQVQALKYWRDRIAASSGLVEVRPGETLLDPRTGKVAFQSAPANASNLALQRFLEENPDASAQQIQAFVQSGRSSRSAASAYINRYLQENPNATAEDVAKAAQDYTKESSAITKFTSGVQGNTVRSFNVLVDHLGVLNDAVGALKNGDVRLLNQAAQEIAVQTGQPAPTNFDSVKSIVGDELVKAIVGGVATIGDREEVKKNIDRAESPEQLAGAIEQYRRLAVGQLKGLQKQYETATQRDDFDSLLSPGTLEYFKSGDKKSAAPPGKDNAPGKPDKDGWVTLPGGIRIREAQ